MTKNQDLADLSLDIKQLRDNLKLAMNALKFYANRQNWHLQKTKHPVTQQDIFMSESSLDKGQRARMVIEVLERKPKKVARFGKVRKYSKLQLKKMGYEIKGFAKTFYIIKQGKAGTLVEFAGKDMKFDWQNIGEGFVTQESAYQALSDYIENLSQITSIACRKVEK